VYQFVRYNGNNLSLPELHMSRYGTITLIELVK